MTTTTHTQLVKSVKGFYELGCKLHRISFQVKHANIADFWWDPYRLYRGDYQGFSFPIVYKYLQGEKLRDVLEDGGARPAIISDRCKQVLLDYKLTGWQTYPVQIHDYDGSLLPGYHGFSIIGRCGPIDKKASPVFQKRFVTNGPLADVCKGVFPDMAQWDGSDFFVPTDSSYFFVSPKAYKVLKKEKLSNVRLAHLPDIEILKSTWLSKDGVPVPGRIWWNPPVKAKG